MKILSRISASVTAAASDTVARFENHEAIERCRLAVAEARLAERQHQRAAERFAEQREKLAADVERWSTRAREHAESDETTALACLERIRHTRQELERLDQDVLAHATAGESISRRLREHESRLSAVTAQHSALSSRATLAKADAALTDINVSSDGIDEVFDRWEAKVDVAEMRKEQSRKQPLVSRPSDDPLAARLAAEERQRSLAIELEELKSSTKTGRHHECRIGSGERRNMAGQNRLPHLKKPRL